MGTRAGREGSQAALLLHFDHERQLHVHVTSHDGCRDRWRSNYVALVNRVGISGGRVERLYFKDTAIGCSSPLTRGVVHWLCIPKKHASSIVVTVPTPTR